MLLNLELKLLVILIINGPRISKSSLGKMSKCAKNFLKTQEAIRQNVANDIPTHNRFFNARPHPVVGETTAVIVHEPEEGRCPLHTLGKFSKVATRPRSESGSARDVPLTV